MRGEHKMRIKWKVRVELNMCAEKEETIIVETNTRKKAIKLAEEKCKKDGNFFVIVLDCEPLGEKKGCA